MSKKEEKDPFEDLANIFQDAANAARKAWVHARERVDSAALDALNRAVKMAWTNARD